VKEASLAPVELEVNARSDVTALLSSKSTYLVNIEEFHSRPIEYLAK
jgi:hypothetical protein